jgi:Fic family protein
MVSLIKRKVGKYEYYYIVHSFRKNGKICKEQKYIGKEIPQNIKEIMQEFKKKGLVEFYQKLEQIKNHFQSEWKKLPESIKEKEKQEIAIAFTYNTNAIEGSTITLEEAREVIEDKTSPNKPLREIKETESHAKTFLEMLKKQEKLSEELVLRWHKEIFGETKHDIAGKYRDYLVRVGEHLAPDWQDIPKLMKEFFAFLKTKGMNPVEFSARAHYRFEKIHPFGDGNGRIGRLIMNHILWLNYYPMLIIEYKKRRSYYKALKKDEEGFVRYYLRRYLAVHKKMIK